jgi:hypothetical protein
MIQQEAIGKSVQNETLVPQLTTYLAKNLLRKIVLINFVL